MPKVYVVTAPDRVRGIYSSWAECQAAVKGVRGARFQAVASRERAEAMLRGEGGALDPGLYAFIDGNHLGGVGIVVVEQPADGEARVLEELALTVVEVFAGAPFAGFESTRRIADELARLRNVLAELGGLYLAVRIVAAGATVTIVHDYEGVGAWMEGRWRTKDPVVADVVAACRSTARERDLTVAFRHQAGHQSSWAGRDDWAQFNAQADRLATEAARGG